METCEFETSKGQVCNSEEDVQEVRGRKLCKLHRGTSAGAYGYPYSSSDIQQALRDFEILKGD